MQKWTKIKRKIKANFNIICKKLKVQKPLKTNGKSMILVDLEGQETTRKLAKWPFGGLVVVLRAPRKRLGWQIGFKIGLGGPS